MRPTAHKTIITVLILLGLCAVPARAQLASYVDSHGNLVFINADSPAPRKAMAEKGAVLSSLRQTTPSGPVASFPTRGSAVETAPKALDRIVQRSAEKNDVDPALVRAVISAESDWDPSAVSSKGALGLMQLVPGTAKLMGVGNAFDPAQNVDAGTRYLRMLLERYNGDLRKALAAYNAGPGVVDRLGHMPNYPETRNYVRKVISTYFHPGSRRQPRAYTVSHPIYRTTDGFGRVVYTNE
jgi:soluble lytic murein transglycosylase-like protein